MRKTGVLLVSLGTPDSPAVADVQKYLKEFLSDPRVIDIKPLARYLLVNGCIVPFRGPKSAFAYSKIWDPITGSPLLSYSAKQQDLLQDALGSDYVVELAMRYQNPSIEDALGRLEYCQLSQLIVIPMFPQYADATTGSIIDKVDEALANWIVIPPVRFVYDFHGNENLIESFCNKGRQYLADGYDHILFSFHGLPQRQLIKCDGNGVCLRSEGCCNIFTDINRHCYSAQCHHTARLIADGLDLYEEDYTICFQSRLGRSEWIQPYTSAVIKKLAGEGKKRILVFCPSFVTDCLETLYEIGMEYNTLFKSWGGEHLQLVESLNDDPVFTSAVKEIILQHAESPVAII